MCKTTGSEFAKTRFIRRETYNSFLGRYQTQVKFSLSEGSYRTTAIAMHMILMVIYFTVYLLEEYFDGFDTDLSVQHWINMKYRNKFRSLYYDDDYDDGIV